jgi:uncharacterized membrane protein
MAWSLPHTGMATAIDIGIETGETSMVFGMAIAVLILKERAGIRRYVATALIACGAIAIRLL